MEEADQQTDQIVVANNMVSEAAKVASDVVAQAKEAAQAIVHPELVSNTELAAMIREVQRDANNQPTNGELALMLKEVKHIALDTRDEAKKTNGRVNALQDWKNQNQEFLENLKTERRIINFKIIDIIIKVVVGIILLKLGWSQFIK